jgi:hypothetical protein
MTTPSSALLKVFQSHLQHMDALLHCGDVTGEEVWAFLNSHDLFVSVAGNMDMGSWAEGLPGQTTLRIHGVEVGLLHGHGLGFGPITRKVSEVFEPEVDLICFGHTHKREWVQDPAGTRILNPGSFSLPKKGPPGYAVVHVEDDLSLRAEWIDLR